MELELAFVSVESSGVATHAPYFFSRLSFKVVVLLRNIKSVEWSGEMKSQRSEERWYETMYETSDFNLQSFFGVARPSPRHFRSSITSSRFVTASTPAKVALSCGSALMNQ